MIAHGENVVNSGNENILRGVFVSCVVDEEGVVATSSAGTLIVV